jgi:YbbR domain-containing protein
LLQGPESLLGSLEAIPTKPIELTGHSDSFRKEIAVDLDPNIAIIEGPSIVKAAVRIEQKIALRTYAGLPVRGENTACRWSISPATIALTLKGPVRMLEQLEEKQDINISVDLGQLKPGLYVRRAKIALPLGIQLVKADPELFSIKIEDPAASCRESSTARISVSFGFAR